MTATDELRRLLDEHGVDYDTPRSCKIDSDTTWHVGEIYYDAFERTDGAIELTAEWEYELTPEQAIAATFKSEREKELEELVRDAYWLIVRAIWSHESQDKFAADWTERVSVLGIEVD